MAFERGEKILCEGVMKLTKLRAARDGYMMISVIFYISGILYMAVNHVPTHTVCMFSGCLLIAYGIVKILGYLSDDLYCLAFQYDLACGLLLIVTGSIVIMGSQRIQQYLIPGLGILILVDALLKIQTAKDARAFGLQTWSWILAASIAAAVFGVLIIVRPFEIPQIIHVIGGMGLMLEGFMNHLTVLQTVKINEKE
ncbi:MAG: DUF308 domain-containing protein [Anaerovoracaceae bacterium]